MKFLVMLTAVISMQAQQLPVTAPTSVPTVKYEELTKDEKLAIRDKQVMITNAEKAAQRVMERLQGDLSKAIAAAKTAHKCGDNCNVIENDGGNSDAPVGLSLARQNK